MFVPSSTTQQRLGGLNRALVLCAMFGLVWLIGSKEARAQWYLGSQSYALNVDKYDARYGEAKPVMWSNQVPWTPRPKWLEWIPFRWLGGLAHPDPFHLRAPWHRGRCRACAWEGHAPQDVMFFSPKVAYPRFKASSASAQNADPMDMERFSQLRRRRYKLRK